MFVVDVYYEMAGWWTCAIGIQIVVGAILFLWNRSRNRVHVQSSSVHIKRLLEWQPLPLVEQEVIAEVPPVMGRLNIDVINFGATNFLSFDKESSVMENALKSLQKYGVGSCGPRGFYGTIDVHLELEERLAEFLKVEEACVYSYGFSTIASAIPAYAKKGDLIFTDECIWFPIQKGIDASRSTVHYYRHNDMRHLEQLLENAHKSKKLNNKRRAFLIAEGIYYNTGKMCPLVKIVQLCRKYKLRIILDESLTIGVLGKHGRGMTEYLNIPIHEIDLIVGSLENSFGTVGGFCAGSHFIVEHQRLSGLGYCFSASLPPMLTQAAITALDLLQGDNKLLSKLVDNAQLLHKHLLKLKNFRVSGDDISPVKHLYLATDDLTDRLKQNYLQAIAAYCMERNVAFSVAAYLRDLEFKCPEPSIRITANINHTEDGIKSACSLLEEAFCIVGPQDLL